MATSGALRRPARILIVASVAAVSLTLTSGIGSAEPAPAPETTAATEDAQPQTAAQAQQQVADMNHELEIVTEQYNEAVILLDQREQVVAVADAQLRSVQGDIADLEAEVAQIAQGAYTGDAVASFTALMTSGSPQEFLDRVNTLDAISGYNNVRAVDLARAQQRALDLTAQAEQARTAASATEADIQAKKTRIETDLPVLEALMATLTDQERQAAMALAHATVEAPGPAAASQEQEAMRQPSVSSAPVSAPTAAAQTAVDTAYAQLGDPYVWAADGPDSFDCSGLTMYSYAAAGISLPHSSNMQSNMGVYVSRSELQPGDLVFYYSPVSHVAIYVGNGQVIHAPNSGSVVELADVDMWGAYNHAQRVALP